MPDTQLPHADEDRQSPAHTPASAGSRLRLLGLDFGSTTSSMMVAEAEIGRHSLTGRMGFGEPRILHRSQPVFTPFRQQTLDETAISRLLDDWLQHAGWQPGSASPAAGAALITGLAARSDNARTLARLISERIGDSLIASADDPRLESWLAFMGSCATLSRAHPQHALINLDIGGGTTNPALGINGQISACGCFYIGARHLTFVPGSYRLSGLSATGQSLLHHLGINKQPGDDLSPEEVAQVVRLMVEALEAIASGDGNFFRQSDCHQQLVQVPFPAAAALDTPRLITFSGGVGELIYRHINGHGWPGTSYFGDLGVDLARAIVQSGVLSAALHIQPEHAGRATVMGLTLHSCDVSGSSLYLSHPQQLPLRDLPIISRLPADTGAGGWQQALALAAGCRQGACLSIEQSGQADHHSIRTLADNIRNAIRAVRLPPSQPLVLLMDTNLGKTLGQYITDWGKEPRALFVIDEIPLREARFVQIGRPHQHIVPVSFFGMN